MRSRLNNEKGFTLVEIIAVLILMGILAAVAVPRYVDLTSNAELRAIEAAVAELNGRENMAWANEKLSTAGYGAGSETTILAIVDDPLGDEYSWATGDPDATGGELTFKNTTQTLNRTASTTDTPGSWAIP